MSRFTDEISPVFVYTMTAGLGDFIVMGDLARKVERLVPSSSVVVVHRGNPHVHLWRHDDGLLRFYDVFSLAELKRFLKSLSGFQKSGRTVFGLQMAPGSLQGYFFYAMLKKIGLVNYIVDFNLINADIITPPRGNYILELHLNQIAELTKCPIDQHVYHLAIPFPLRPVATQARRGVTVGIHPWSRRGDQPAFVWPREKWAEVINHAIGHDGISQVVVFGKDKGFDEFLGWLREQVKETSLEYKIVAAPSSSVEELAKTVAETDLLLSVNTSVVHLGYALNKKMVILCGPTLDLWIPKGEGVHTARDEDAVFHGADRWMPDERFGSVARIKVDQVVSALDDLLNCHAGVLA